MWRVATNIINKRLRTAYNGWFTSLRVERGAKNPLTVQNYDFTKCDKIIVLGLRTRTSGDLYEHGNERSHFEKGGEFI